MKGKALFIINPISGGKDKEYVPMLIKQMFSNHEYEIVFTERADHATEITEQGMKLGFENFIAIGGDGTVNEVAKSLIGTTHNLGIIPFGSGNGLARHNKIPMHVKGAFEVIINHHITRIDTCELNGLPFINMSGAGFDAHIGKLFAESKEKGRGFQKYISTTIHEFMNYKSQNYTLSHSGKKVNINAFLISFANSSQYGNNAFIAPNANMQDGLIDVCIMKPFPPINIVELGYKLFTRGIENSRYFETFKTDSIEVLREQDGEIHVDGEPVNAEKKLTIKVIPSSLNIITPNM
ncbi:MAG: diacylglycerol kinase family lipid kinase [Cytophagales bacterium]|nr:diacylglycerol kinase family lipid kinase [Cytophagales bacterium]